MFSNKKLLVILGPTSTGKTDLALFLAQKFSGEIVSADSRQVYKGLDIGTGKMPNGNTRVKKGEGFWEINGIKVWMYDVIEPFVQFNVADYVITASKIVEDINKKGKLPILTGGTGLYLRSLIYGLSNINKSFDPETRKKLVKLNLNQLQEKLKSLSLKKWENMNYSDKQNPRRLIRAIELQSNKDEKVSDISKGLVKDYDVLIIGLTAPKKNLYERSDKRVVVRIKQGMIKETEGLNKKGLSITRMKELGLEYGILADFLEEKIETEEELIKILQNKIHGYIKRQLTWFKKEPNVNWFDITTPNVWKKIENEVAIWYDSPIGD